MAKEKQVKKKKAPKSKQDKTYNFSSPHDYYIATFGRPDEPINMYVLNLSVGHMLQDFKIFEDLNNVSSWPISTLIQRELDHKRASLICKDYLLKGGDTKYFPPLIAVLIPTDNEYKPLDEFPPSSSEETKAIEAKFVKANEYYDQYEPPEAISGGITKIPFGGDQGDLVWDKGAVSAVVIDGQHRYKALDEAKKLDKTFEDCLVTITLIDLTEICASTGKTPTDVARDLFVTINNTPIEVDETRLVLMDDKDVLSTFTQVLIDDSFEDEKPAIPPELIDWDCEGGKHNISNSLSGVLVLRQIILSAMFDEAKVSTVDDRTNVRGVRKWKDKIEDWLAPDEQIESEIGAQEKISHRFRLAEEEIRDNHDDEEEDSIFLFSYSSVVSRLLKKRFKELYLSSFEHVFSSLLPFEKISTLAKKHGVLDVNKPLNNYYRAFKGKREVLRKGNQDIKNAVSMYEKECATITDKSIPHTVMGQKSIFKALFDGFLSSAQDKTNDEYLELAKEFSEGFNDIYGRLCPSMSSDENFFLTDYKMKKNKVSKAKSVGGDFWKGIIIKYNGEIDYSRSAVLIMSQLIQDLIFYLYTDTDEDAEDSNSGDSSVFEFTDFNKLVQRHKRLINKLEFEDDLTEEEQLELAEKVVKSKQKELERLLNQ